MSFNSTASMSGGCESRAKAGQLSFKVQVKGRALSNSRARSRARIISSEKEAVFQRKRRGWGLQVKKKEVKVQMSVSVKDQGKRELLSYVQVINRGRIKRRAGSWVLCSQLSNWIDLFSRERRSLTGRATRETRIIIIDDWSLLHAVLWAVAVIQLSRDRERKKKQKCNRNDDECIECIKKRSPTQGNRRTALAFMATFYGGHYFLVLIPSLAFIITISLLFLSRLRLRKPARVVVCRDERIARYQV